MTFIQSVSATVPTISSSGDITQNTLAQLTFTFTGSDYDSLAATIVGVPAASSITTGDLVDPTTLTPDLTPDVAGTYVCRMTATKTDGGGTGVDTYASATAKATIGGTSGSIREDLTSKTLNVGNTAGVVVSRSSTNVEIGDVAANLTIADMSEIVIESLVASRFYVVRLEWTNPGSFDRGGMAIGYVGTGANQHGLAGLFETSAQMERWHCEYGNGTAVNGGALAGAVAVEVSFSVGADGKVSDWNSAYYDSSNNIIDTETTDVADGEKTLTAGKLSLYVRSGNAGHGGNCNFNYQLDKKSFPLAT